MSPLVSCSLGTPASVGRLQGMGFAGGESVACSGRRQKFGGSQRNRRATTWFKGGGVGFGVEPGRLLRPGSCGEMADGKRHGGGESRRAWRCVNGGGDALGRDRGGLEEPGGGSPVPARVTWRSLDEVVAGMTNRHKLYQETFAQTVVVVPLLRQEPEWAPTRPLPPRLPE